MKVEEKVYTLGSQSGKALNKTDNLLLAINGVRTELPVREFFSSFSQNDDSIKGHSFFGEFPIEDYRIVLSDLIQISLWNKNSDEEILITGYKFPLVQKADMETPGEVLLDKIQQLYDEMQNPDEEEREIKVEMRGPEEMPIIEEEQEEEQEEEGEEEQEEGQEEEQEDSGVISSNADMVKAICSGTISLASEKGVDITEAKEKFNSPSFKRIINSERGKDYERLIKLCIAAGPDLELDEYSLSVKALYEFISAYETLKAEEKLG